MNIRGVSFRVPQGRNDILQEILDGINVQTLFWYNVESQNEVWSVPHYKDFFKEEYYSGQDFYEQIKLPHLVIFLKLQAYSLKKSRMRIFIHMMNLSKAAACCWC